jgi:hypothetical protein
VPSAKSAKGVPKLSSLVVNIPRSPYFRSVLNIIVLIFEKATRPTASEPIHLKFAGHVAFQQQMSDRL